MTVTLACSWYPRGELARLQRLLPALRDLYADVVIAVHNGTDESEQAIDWLQQADVMSVTFAGWSGRHAVVERALALPPDFIQYADLDRLLRWVELRPDELADTVARIPDQDCLIMGRTANAWATHPRCMVETERLFNLAFSHYFGRILDLGAGSRGLSRAAAELVVRYGPLDEALAMDAGWTVLVQRAGLTWDFVEVDGLDWETPDQYRDFAADSDTQGQAAETYDADVNNWSLRTSVAEGILRLGLDAMTIPLGAEKEQT